MKFNSRLIDLILISLEKGNKIDDIMKLLYMIDGASVTTTETKVMKFADL